MHACRYISLYFNLMLKASLTFARVTGGSFCFNAVAAFSYSGARDLQWPHLCMDTWVCEPEVQVIHQSASGYLPWCIKLHQYDVFFIDCSIKSVLCEV